MTDFVLKGKELERFLGVDSRASAIKFLYREGIPFRIDAQDRLMVSLSLLDDWLKGQSVPKRVTPNLRLLSQP